MHVRSFIALILAAIPVATAAPAPAGEGVAADPAFRGAIPADPALGGAIPAVTAPTGPAHTMEEPGALPVAIGEAAGTESAPDPAAAQEAMAAADPDQIDGVVTRLEGEERAAQRAQRALHERERQSVARTVAFGRAYVRAVRAGLLPVAGGFVSFVDHASRLERLRRAAERELDSQRAITREREAVAARLRDLGARLTIYRANERALAHAHSAILAARDREQAFQRAFDGTAAGAAVIYGPGAGPLDPALAAGGFAALRGRLPFPVAGRTVLQIARRPGIQGPGIDVRAAPASAVRSVFAGRVAFADDYAAYGRTVILDHGDRYFSVSAALGEISVEVGDDLPAGARIGTVARDLDGGSMYFEIRHGAETIEAADWLGI